MTKKMDDCIWFKYKDICTLSNRECISYRHGNYGVIESDAYFCSRHNRITDLISTAWRNKIHKLTDKDKDYLKYTHRKMAYPSGDSGLVKELSEIVGFILMEECRVNSLCPTKALLPEFDESKV
jgi:hypothetical protein